MTILAFNELGIELEQAEMDQTRENSALPGVLAYGATREEAVARAKALALRVLAERLEHGEGLSQMIRSPTCHSWVHANSARVACAHSSSRTASLSSNGSGGMYEPKRL